MPRRLTVYLIVSFAIALTFVIKAQQPTLGRAPLVPPSPVTPIKLIAAIAVPPFLSSIDIMWVDQTRGRLYIADRTNSGIDIIDTINNTYVGRVPGFISSTAASAIPNQGPNGVVVTPKNILWAGDSNSTLQVVDLNANPPQIIKSILIGSTADGRADELAYDPFENLILIANDASTPPRVTFIDADSYQQLGQIKFPDANGMEQPVWDTQLHAFIVNVPAAPVAYEAVIDPRTMTVTKRLLVPDCLGGPGTAGVNGLALGPFHHLLVSACGNAYVMNANDGTIITKITQVGGGDEVWYNPGDGGYYLVPLGLANATVMGLVDATTNVFVGSAPGARLRNLAAYEGNNHIFSVATRPTVGTPDVTPCVAFNIINTGCVAVYGH